MFDNLYLRFFFIIEKYTLYVASEKKDYQLIYSVLLYRDYVS